MGRAEELHKPAKAAPVLWVLQGHPGLRQILQELAFLLDPSSWALCKLVNIDASLLGVLYVALELKLILVHV